MQWKKERDQPHVKISGGALLYSEFVRARHGGKELLNFDFPLLLAERACQPARMHHSAKVGSGPNGMSHSREVAARQSWTTEIPPALALQHPIRRSGSAFPMLQNPAVGRPV